MLIKFTKMQAYGNDYVYVNTINQNINGINYNEFAKYVSDRHFAVGSDGLVLICPSHIADFKMRIFNTDGTEAQMCGNAVRSVAKYVYVKGLTTKEDITVETIGGIIKLKLIIKDSKVINISANIGKAILKSKEIPVNTERTTYIKQKLRVLDKTFEISSVSFGNPHCVVFVDDISNVEVSKYGPLIENNTDIFPERTNVTFAQIIDKNNISIRQWERGCEETISCATGCAAATTIAHLLGYCNNQVDVKQIGGTIKIIIDEETSEVTMIGNSHIMFDSEIEFNI